MCALVDRQVVTLEAEGPWGGAKYQRLSINYQLERCAAYGGASLYS